MKLLNLIAFLMLTGFAVQAQKYELGEVTKAELEEKQHPADASAPAAILYSKGKTYMTLSETSGFELVTEVEMKIKIYCKDGYGWANKSILLYSSQNSADKETIDITKAVTYNLEGGNIKKTKLKSEGEFMEQVNKYYRQKKIMMPDVKEGSVVEYRYTIRSPFITVFPDWDFQKGIPVNHSEYTTKIPEYFSYNPNFRGYYVPKINRTKSNVAYTYTSKERSGALVTKTTFENNKIEYSEDVIVYTLDNLPAMKDENYVNNIGNYTASIEHELALTKYPNQPMKTYSTNWEDVTKTIYKQDDFGPELNKTGYFEEDLKALLSGVTVPAEKIAVIYFYVRNRMHWNEYTGYSCDAGVKKAYTDKTGNVAEINLMLTAMLRYAGLSANPVLVSTRSNKIALYPNRSAFNYVIAAVETDGKVMLLDATSKSGVPNVLPIRALNWTGRLIRKEGTSENIDLTPQVISKDVINVSAQLGADGKITGRARDQYFDYNAFLFREFYGNVNKDSYVEKLEKRHKGIEIGEYKVTNDKDYSKPVVEDYEFTHNGLVDIMGDKIYLNPLLFYTETESPFKVEKREYPIDFIFPHQDKYMISIVLPQGYVVESLPKPTVISMEDNLGSFKYNIGSSNNVIQIGVSLDINQSNVSQEYYPTIKDFYQKMIEKQAEKIVLKKG